MEHPIADAPFFYHFPLIHMHIFFLWTFPLFYIYSGIILFVHYLFLHGCLGIYNKFEIFIRQPCFKKFYYIDYFSF